MSGFLLFLPIGHATIPPALRPFLGGKAPGKEEPHGRNPAVEAAFAQIKDALGEDVQEIDPDVGVGNVSAHIGPVLVPDGAKGAKGRAFTAKVKIIESDRLPAPAAEDAGDAGEEAARESPWASHAAAVVPAAALPSSHAPPVSVPENQKEKENASPRDGRSRGRAIAVAIAALGVVVAVGVWIVARGPREVANMPEPAVRGTATVAPAVPLTPPSGEAVVAPAPVAVPVSPATVDAGASLAPSAATGNAPVPYKPKGSVVKGEEPYNAAAPLPVKTVEPVVPPPLPTPTPPIAPPPVTAVPSALPKAPPAASTGRILGSDEG